MGKVELGKVKNSIEYLSIKNTIRYFEETENKNFVDYMVLLREFKQIEDRFGENALRLILIDIKGEE